LQLSLLETQAQPYPNHMFPRITAFHHTHRLISSRTSSQDSTLQPLTYCANLPVISCPLRVRALAHAGVGWIVIPVNSGNMCLIKGSAFYPSAVKPAADLLSFGFCHPASLPKNPVMLLLRRSLFLFPFPSQERYSLRRCSLHSFLHRISCRQIPAGSSCSSWRYARTRYTGSSCFWG